MAKKPAPEIDDELFNEVYGKEYTGPPGLTAKNAQDSVKSNKRPLSADANRDSDEEDEPHDPNAIPTDFTSREAKVWEAKAKATERNWKKRKEEEMICKICGESGHFTQGCPSTLGSNRKSQDFIERVPAREKHVKALFTEKVIHRIEKDVGCKLKMEEKFIIVSGKDRLVLAKGVEAVKEVIKEEDKGKKKGPSSSHRTRSQSPDRSPVASRVRRSESQRSHQSPKKQSQFQSRPFNQEKIVESRLREDLQQLSRSSPQVKRRSRSPRPNFIGDSLMSYDGLTQNMDMRKTDSWDTEGHGADAHKFKFHGYSQTLEELELEFKREAMEIGRIHDKEEDEENVKHRECIMEMRENYMKKLSVLRSLHVKQWEEFLQLDAQRRQRMRQHMSASSYNAYSHPGFSDYDQPSGASQYSANNLAVDSRSRYLYADENYSAPRAHNSYSEFQRQRHEDFGKPYNRY